MQKIIISVEDLSVQAELNDTNTAEKIFKALPIEGTVNLWGDEIYFDIPLELDLENDARADVEVGELGYWPSGPAFCIFFGPTPVSKDEKPRAYSPVNIFGRIIGNSTQLKTVSNGSKIRVTRSEE
ncbi:MAG: cyclophilin-like fold protein [Desulfobacterales bacterium]|nr:cyclophilin-like fold protein [Desulfobacterales bacterium]